MLDHLIGMARERNENGQLTSTARAVRAAIEAIVIAYMAAKLMHEERVKYEKEKQKRIDAWQPKTNRQALKFLEFANKLAYDSLKESDDAEYCPHCGYLVQMNYYASDQHQSAITFWCPMCRLEARSEPLTGVNSWRLKI